jgi:hypothetical protein
MMTRKRLLLQLSCILVLGSLAMVCAHAQAPTTPVDANDIARYLAGLPVASSSALAELTRDPHWIAHSNAMNAAFKQMNQRQLNNVRAWRAGVLGSVVVPGRTCVYLFGGPDYLNANAFFPNQSNYILQGLEAVEVMPDPRTLPDAELQAGLQSIEVSLIQVLNYSFFQTKDMRSDLSRSRLKGVLPILFVFFAREGLDVTGVNYLSLQPGGTTTAGMGGSVPGVQVSLRDPANGSTKNVYYFRSDLANGFVHGNPAVLRFCERFGPANSFLKAASYLLHQDSFSITRDWLLSHSTVILQDDSGIPIRFFPSNQWTIRVFGAYHSPIELFKQYYQPDLRQIYDQSNPKTLTFGFGYQVGRNSTVILAVRK